MVGNSSTLQPHPFLAKATDRSRWPAQPDNPWTKFKAASALSTDETTDNALNDIPACHPDWLGLTRAIAGCVFDRESTEVGSTGEVGGSVHEADAALVDTLHVASINVASLQQTGNIKIEWTGCFSSHLDFDPGRLDAISGGVTPVLKIFRHPSLCYQHAPPSSILQQVSGMTKQIRTPTNPRCGLLTSLDCWRTGMMCTQSRQGLLQRD